MQPGDLVFVRLAVCSELGGRHVPVSRSGDEP